MTLACTLLLAVAPFGETRWLSGGCTAATPVGVNPFALSNMRPTAQAVEAAPVDPAMSKYEWRKGTDSQSWLYRDGQCIGQWYFPEGLYYSWDGKQSGKAGKPPIDPPGRGAEAQEKLQAWQLSGVNLDKVSTHEQYSLSGQPLDPARLEDAFEGNLADDSSKGYFVVISKDAAKRDAILSDWAALPKDFTERYHVWAASPDHFSMIDRATGKTRFYAAADPTIILEAPKGKGKVLFRHPTTAEQVYEPRNMKDLLKADPDYKPALDPGVPGSNPSIPPWALIAGAVGAAVLVQNKKKP